MTIYSILVFSLVIILIIYSSYTTEGFQDTQPTIIGYFHVCQLGDWRRSFDLSMDTLKKYGLFHATKELRIGILSETGAYEDDPRFHDPKLSIVYSGTLSEYERPTLLHMRENSFKDPSDTLYYYVHTKGIKHFNTKNEPALITWINSMLHWNFELWRDAVKILETYETYGIHYGGKHYSGNFWWATAKHIQKLPATIPDYYTAPEDWVLLNKDGMYCAYNCGEAFVSPYPQDFYQ